jgi:Galactose oxidase-like, Early set domain
MLDGKVFYFGGGGGGETCSSLPQNTAEVIDLNAGTPTWSLLPTTISFRRRQANATVLPDGTVLVTGGTSACGFTSEAGAVYAAELFQPAAAAWTTLANAGVVRVYHSTTTLLPDGRVLSTGSGDGAGVTSQYSYEIFSPPYLFKGARPTYSLGSTQLHYGVPFTVTTPDAVAISKVTVLRLTSTTHAFDAGQRLNTLSFQVAADGQSLTVTPPAAGRIAPPGPYMLFIVNGNGVPSVAETVLLN